MEGKGVRKGADERREREREREGERERERVRRGKVAWRRDVSNKTRKSKFFKGRKPHCMYTAHCSYKHKESLGKQRERKRKEEREEEREETSHFPSSFFSALLFSVLRTHTVYITTLL